jgi:hypothetical protein
MMLGYYSAGCHSDLQAVGERRLLLQHRAAGVSNVVPHELNYIIMMIGVASTARFRPRALAIQRLEETNAGKLSTFSMDRSDRANSDFSLEAQRGVGTIKNQEFL